MSEILATRLACLHSSLTLPVLHRYLTATEWATQYGGHRPTRPESREFRRLPFTHCALSLQPFEHPLCTADGHCFDLLHIVPFVRRYKIDPITGKVGWRGVMCGSGDGVVSRTGWGCSYDRE